MTTIHFRAVNYKADIKLKEFAIQRLEKLSQFYNQIIEIYVFTKVENTSDKINKKTEIKISIPGDDVIVKKICKTFEEGISSAADSAERILKKRKGKIRN
jgi:putative sigma-54 modulation protein